MDMDLSCESKNTPESRVLDKAETRRMILKMANIKKKTRELSILCDTPVFLIAHYPDGKTETLPEDESELMELIRKYKSTKKNKKFKYVKRPKIDDFVPNRTSENEDSTRAERFSKLTSVGNREIVMRVIRERIELLKRRRSEIEKGKRIGTTRVNRGGGEIDSGIVVAAARDKIETPMNLDIEIDNTEKKIETTTPVTYCEVNTEVIMESDEEEEIIDLRSKSPPQYDQSDEQETVQLTKSPPRPDQSEEEVTDQSSKSPSWNDEFSLNYIPIHGTLYVPRNFKIGDNMSEGNYVKFPPIFMPQQQQDSSLERDFIAGFDAAAFSTKKLG